MDRTQFTFYESFFKAISRIKKDADRGRAYDAICAYALYGTEPDMDTLPDSAAIAFELSKPNLDASRRKAKSGKAGGTAKQIESKTEANRKQNGSKTEANEKQTASKKKKEKENKKENKCYNPLPPLDGVGEALQSAFSDWLKYKSERKEEYTPTGLSNLQAEIRNNAARYGDVAVADLIRKCMASGWRGIIFEKLSEAPTKPKNGPTYTQPSAEQVKRNMEDMERTRRLLAMMKEEENGQDFPE